jgi:serine/threonine-protein kinase
VGGRYVVREQIGAGAFGQVFRAEHRVLDVTLRSVALKRFTGGDAATAMLREALRIERLVGRCPDPVVRDRLVHCLDAGVDDGVPYLVMELAEGSLADRVGPDRRWPVATVRTWLRQICEGVGFLHQQGTVHLDLKPANVLRTAETLKIGDFGCAERITDLRRSGTSGGTLTHQAPETLGAGAADARADVYAIGMIGYELVTGRLPRHRELAAALPGDHPPDIDELRRIKMRPAVPPGELASAVRGDRLEEILVSAMAPSPADRPADATALLAELDRPATAEPPPPAVPTPERVRSRGLLLAQALRAGDLDLAERLAAEAAAVNDALPRNERVIELYPDLVDLALRRGDVATARAIATEGLALVSCPVTWRAAARAFAGTPSGDGFDRMWSGR